MVSQIRQNYHENTENAVNTSVSHVLNASYHFLDLAYFFDRDDVALSNLHKYFLKLSESKREQADKLLKYQNIRGGLTKFQTISKPPQANDSMNVEGAFKIAIEIEKGLNEHFIGLHQIADETKDAHFSDFLEEDLMEPQVEILKELANHYANAQRVKDGLGEFLFDKEFES